MITLIPEIDYGDNGTNESSDRDGENNNKQSNYFLPPFHIRELEDLRNLVLYASTHLEKLILSSKLEPQTVEDIEKLENKIKKALTDLSSYPSNNEIAQKISDQSKAFRIRDLMITILMDSEPCDAGCSHGGSIPCPAGAESHEPPPPPPPPPPPAPPAPTLGPSPDPTHDTVQDPTSPRRELADLRGLLEHALVRLGNKQPIKTETPKNIKDIEELKKKLEGALESLLAMKEKLKPK